LTDKEIAADLGIAISTVRTHLERFIERTACVTRLRLWRLGNTIVKAESGEATDPENFAFVR
jgi:DNA-binding CsgD family transcriptional regulator